MNKQELEIVLNDRFWLPNFRELQFEIISSVLSWNDTLVFMPTWWGKSLTYQFPWVVMEGLCIVISPLISLMKDQVDKLNELWIRAELVNSSITSFQKTDILNELSITNFDSNNDIKFLYIAPERLNDREFLWVIKNIKIALISIDEAHCISQWGHDFRPWYLKIKDFISNLRQNKSIPVIALTATATKKVRKDIVDRLWINSYNTFTSGFDRKNLFLVVREISKEQEKFEKVFEIIQKTSPYWIVYCSSVKAVWKVYEYLLEKWIRVWKYTWEMSQNDRERSQNLFMNWNLDVIIATNAFGMWIDKKDIRYVIHFNLPGSIENYYQEIWRAWRDGKPSYAVIIASYQDTIIQEFFITNSYPPKDDILKFYDYLYREFKIWEWRDTTILKTYAELAYMSWISAMQVWTILKIFEKYDIVKRWADSDNIDFRWKWITILLPKKSHKDIPILWSHQEVLKDEWFFKLEQIKKLLFKPGCRNKFILNYFWDEEDLRNLKDNCGRCDYCIDRKKLWNEDITIIPRSVFISVLEFVKNMDEKFGLQVLSAILAWSKESKILSWELDKNKYYWLFSDYKKDFIVSIFEVLLSQGFLYKTNWEYPKIGLSHKWMESTYNTDNLYKEEKELQSLLYLKTKSISKYSEENEVKTKTQKTKKVPIEKIDTYTATLEMYNSWLSLNEIREKRELWFQTIQEHMVKLYVFNKVDLQKIMTFTSIDKLKTIKEIINNNTLQTDKLRPIKDLLWEDYSYFDIRICLAMIEKKDI